MIPTPAPAAEAWPGGYAYPAPPAAVVPTVAPPYPAYAYPQPDLSLLPEPEVGAGGRLGRYRKRSLAARLVGPVVGLLVLGGVAGAAAVFRDEIKAFVGKLNGPAGVSPGTGRVRRR